MHSAILYKKLDNGDVQCLLCAHYCKIDNGNSGTCKLRINRNGKLNTLTWGAAEAVAIDPIEKKPFFHFKPKSRVLSFGTPGCNFSCDNCQNNILSQAVRDKLIRLDEIDISLECPVISSKLLFPEDIVDLASENGVDGIAYTYSEPTIFFEYVRDTVLSSRKNPKTKDLFHVFVSNGYFSKEMLDLVIKENLLQAINIDLKFINNKQYDKICEARLQPVLDSIQRIWNVRDKIHLEIINLVIPDENDSEEDIKALCEFISSVSNEIPLHFSRFYPNYKMQNKASTSMDTLINAREIAKKAGLKYIYIGNTNLEDAEDTLCPNCKFLLIRRNHYAIRTNVFARSLKPVCPKCKTPLNFIL